MKRVMTILAATSFVAACAGEFPVAPSATTAAGGASSASQVGTGPSVVGSAHRLSGGEQRTVTFSAVTLPDGTVSGEAEINVRVLDAWWHTRLECLTVVGNRAFLGGTVTAGSDSRIQVGSKSYFWVEDNGEGSNAPPDRVSIANPNETQQGLDDFCNLVQNLLPGSDVIRGNVQIR